MPTALIVEDEPEANHLLAMLVQLRGYQTSSAYTGGEALDPLPRLDDRTVRPAERLRQRNAETPGESRRFRSRNLDSDLRVDVPGCVVGSNGDMDQAACIFSLRQAAM